jgi:parvulin-like peptidyl-prolyl isomerase
MNILIKKSTFTAICVLVVFVMIFSLSACEDENAGGTGRADKAGGEGEVLAVAEGEDVTRQQVDDLCAFMAFSYNMPLDSMSESDRATLFNQMLIYIADNVIIRNYVNESDKEAAENAETSVAQQLEMIKTQNAEMDQQLSAAGITDDTLKSYIETQYYQGIFYDQVTAEYPVTDAEAQAYYDEHKAEFVTPESIGLSHILIMDEEHTDENRTSIEAIRQRALDGEDFAELATQYSADSAENGGDLGIVARGQGLVEPFEEAGFKLKKGEISDIVETQYGFHIIKANTDLVPEEQMSFEAARSQIDSVLSQERFYEEMEKLKAEHPVTYNVEVDPATGEPPTTVTESETTDAGVATE